MVAPRLVREGGATECSIAATVPRCSWTASARPPRCAPCASALREVCRTGTGAGFFRDTTRFRAAGKTGTAQFSQDGIRYSRRILHGQHGGLRAGREAPLYHLRDHPHAPRGGRAYYGGLAGPRGQAPGLPTSTTASTTGNAAAWSGATSAARPVRMKGATWRRCAAWRAAWTCPACGATPARDGGARTPTARRW